MESNNSLGVRSITVPYCLRVLYHIDLVVNAHFVRSDNAGARKRHYIYRLS